MSPDPVSLPGSLLPDTPATPNAASVLTAATPGDAGVGLSGVGLSLSSLPPPPLPADCDLSDFRFMPLDIGRLLGSHVWIAAAEEPKIAHAMLSLWCEAWRQVPSGSLPNHDKVLMRLAQCDSREWQRIRPGAMDGFVLCADNRWYHPHLTDKAMAAWERRLEYRHRMQRVRTGRKPRPGEPGGNEGSEQIPAAGGINHQGDAAAADDFHAANEQDNSMPSVHNSVHSPGHNPVDSDEHNTVSPLPLSREDREKDKKRKREGEGKTFERRGTRLPPHWVLPDEWRLAAEETCTQFKLSPGNLDLEAAKFRDFWLAKPGVGAVKLDWRATWLNWIRRMDQSTPHTPKTGFDPVAYLAKQQAGKGAA